MWRDLWAKNQKEFVFAVGMICFLVAGLIVAGFPSPTRNQARTQTPRTVERAPLPEPAGERETALGVAAFDAAEQEVEWVLYITGAVRRPGVYRLPAESRLFQLVDIAGGFNTSADPVAVNLAALLQDGLHVHVPEIGEEPPAHGMPGGTAPSAVSAQSPAARDTPGRLVNINRASVEELVTLRGIGPVIAGNIVNFRLQNGRFHSVDDLIHVSGIGPRKLEDLRGAVTVGP